MVPEAEMVDALLDEARKLVEEGVEARLAAAEAGADEEAQKEAALLRELRGDANQAVARRAAVSQVVRGDE